MVRRTLSSRGGPPTVAEQGFTLIESMIAMSIAITVLLANIYLINTANKNFALARSLTDATNLATNRIADFRSMTVAEINAVAPTVQGGGNPLNVRQGSDTQCPDCPGFDCSSSDCSPGAIRFTRTWIVSAIDLEHANPPVADMVGDLVKIDLAVSWTLLNKGHRVTMTLFTAGKAP